MQMVKNSEGLDGKRRGDLCILNHHEVIAVLFLAASGKIRGSRKYLRRRKIEVGDNKFVMLVDPLPSRPLSLERIRNVLCQKLEIDDTDCAIRFAHLEAADVIRNTIAEHILLHKPVDCFPYCARLGLIKESNAEKDRRCRLIDRCAQRTERQLGIGMG